MSTSGTFTKSLSNGAYKVQVSWSQSKDIANNRSALTLKAYFINTKAVKIDKTDNYFVIDGDAYDLSSPAISTIGTHALGSKTVYVKHTDEGKKTVSINFLYNVGTKIGGSYYGNIVANQTVTLDSIPRASSVTASSTDIGTETVIKISSAYSGFTHSLTYTFCGAVGQIPMAQNTDRTVSWTPPMYMCSSLPNSTSSICTITCVTYYNGKPIGDKQTRITLRVPSSVKPNITNFKATPIDGDVPTDWEIYVQTKSKCKLQIVGAKGSYGSTIKSYSITGGGFSSNESTLETGFLNSSGSITFTAKVTDSRGRTAEKTATIDVVPYKLPQIRGYSVDRCLADHTLSDTGAYLLGYVYFSHSKCNGKNTITTTVEYKQTGEDSYTDTGVTFENQKDFVFGDGRFSAEYSYEIRYTITDAFTSVSVTELVSTSQVVMDFLKGGLGVAVGKVAEESKCFELADTWKFKLDGMYIKDYILKNIYSVGSVVFTREDADPSEIYGGEWECFYSNSRLFYWERVN